MKDVGAIESVLSHVQNGLYYPDFVDKLSHLFYGLVKNHACNDGNKRMAITASSMFLQKNTNCLISHFDIDLSLNLMEFLAVFVADNIFNKNDLKNIFAYALRIDNDDLLVFVSCMKSFNIMYYEHIQNKDNVPIEMKNDIYDFTHRYITDAE